MATRRRLMGQEAQVRLFADTGAAITPHDTNTVGPFAYLYVGVQGAVKVRTMDGTTVLFAVIPAGTTIQIEYDLVYDTDTDATSIVGLGKSFA